MSFFSDYFNYVGDSESPNIYHRWTAISMVGAMLGRQIHLPFGHGVIYPNQYIMLMGSPGARKGTAMGIGSKLLKAAGYQRFCPNRLSKERFLMEMKPYQSEELLVDADLETLVFDAPSEVYAFAEEFTDFIGQGGMEFMTMLTNLWDNLSKYEHPKIHGKSIVVEKPTVNIFGANTAQGLLLAIPIEALGNGFTSRMIFIFSEPTGRRITFPKKPSEALRIQLVQRLKDIREHLNGEITYTEEAMELLDSIYQNAIEVNDPRFKHYETRRFTHLLKLCMILAAAELEMMITAPVVVHANTVLYAAERRMPRALGEFGKNRNSDVANAIMDIMNHTDHPISLTELFKKVSKDVPKMADLGDIMRNLHDADKVQIINVKGKQGKQGYIAKHTAVRDWPEGLVDMNLLTEEERV